MIHKFDNFNIHVINIVFIIFILSLKNQFLNCQKSLIYMSLTFVVQGLFGTCLVRCTNTAPQEHPQSQFINADGYLKRKNNKSPVDIDIDEYLYFATKNTGSHLNVEQIQLFRYHGSSQKYYRSILQRDTVHTRYTQVILYSPYFHIIHVTQQNNLLYVCRVMYIL